ncbi:MAG: head GIN domain-containing protein [Bacillota bacterium]
MKKLFTIVISLTILVFAGCHGFGFGCHGVGVRGSGVSKTETRNLDKFSAVEVGGAFYVDIVNGESPSIQLSGDDNILPLIKTEVRDNTLYITTKKSINPKKKMRLRIATENLERVDESGACDVNITNVNSDRFIMDISGASKINVSGKTRELMLDLSGAGKVNARDLIAEKADVEISGAAKAEVYVSEDLRADISGVGNLDYYGNPKKISKDISGVASVTQR